MKRKIVEEKRPVGRPPLPPGEKMIRLSSFLVTPEEYGYILRFAKIKRIKNGPALRLMIDQQMENHPDREMITHRREELKVSAYDLDYVEKIYNENMFERLQLARSMLWGYIENNYGNNFKKSDAMAHMEKVQLKTGIKLEIVEELFYALHNKYNVNLKPSEKDELIDVIEGEFIKKL